MVKKLKMLFIIICISLFVFSCAPDTGSEIKTEQAQRVAQNKSYIDMFVGSREESDPVLIYGTLEVWEILTRCYGDPLRPSKKGAVLTSANSVSYAILRSRKSTVPVKIEGKQQIFYIDSGKGILKWGDKTADLDEGIGVLVAPGIEFSIKNTGDENLTMYIIEEPIKEDFITKKLVVVKDANDNPVSTNINRVNDASKWLFSRYDGLSVIGGINPIIWQPKSYFPPHVHPVGEEEIWVVLKGDMDVMIGNERFSLPAGSAYKVPADGKTPHVNLNRASQFRKVLWIMSVPPGASGKSPERFI